MSCPRKLLPLLLMAALALPAAAIGASTPAGEAEHSNRARPGLVEASSPLKGRVLRERRSLTPLAKPGLLPAAQTELSKALTEYEREIKRKSARINPRGAVGPPCSRRSVGVLDLRSKGIIIVGGKPGSVKKKVPGAAGSPRTLKRNPRGRIRPGPDLSSKGIMIINGRPGTMTRLQRAVHRFERALGLKHPAVRKCQGHESACMRRCRTGLRGQGLSGQCSCIGARAQCLSRVPLPSP